MNKEPIVDLDLVVAEVAENVESANADLKVNDPEDGEDAMKQLLKKEGTK